MTADDAEVRRYALTSIEDLGWTPIRRYVLSCDITEDHPPVRARMGRGAFVADHVRVELFDRGGRTPVRSLTIIVSGRAALRDGTTGVQRRESTLDATRLDTYLPDVLPDWLRAKVAPAVSVLVGAVQ